MESRNICIFPIMILAIEAAIFLNFVRFFLSFLSILSMMEVVNFLTGASAVRGRAVGDI